jgi:hypothetical protein
MSDFRDRLGAQLESAAGQLARRAARSTAGPAGRCVGGGRFRRLRSGARQRLAIVVALAVTLLLAAVALAATGVVALRGARQTAAGLADEAIAATAHDRPCEIVATRPGSKPIDQPPLPQITALLPELAAKVRPSPALLAAATGTARGPVLANTIREARFPGDIRILIFVSNGSGLLTPGNPPACLADRLARLATLRPNAQDPVRAAAAVQIRQRPETSPGAELLFIDALAPGPGPPRSSGGSATAVAPNSGPLRSGLTQSTGCGPPPPRPDAKCGVIYAGIAAPGADHVIVAPVRRGQVHGVTRQVPIDDGLFAFALSRGTGPEQVSSVSAAGVALQTQTIRLR